MVLEMQQELMQAGQQLAQAQAQLQHTIPAQQEHCQLVRKLHALCCACWDRPLSAELSGLILGKAPGYNVRRVAVSFPLLRDTANAAEPTQAERWPWSRAQIAAGGYQMLCVSADATGVCLHGARINMTSWVLGTKRREWCWRW